MGKRLILPIDRNVLVCNNIDMKSKKLKRINISLPEDFFVQLKIIAFKNRTSFSGIVREGLVLWLERRNNG